MLASGRGYRKHALQAQAQHNTTPCAPTTPPQNPQTRPANEAVLTRHAADDWRELQAAADVY